MTDTVVNDINDSDIQNLLKMVKNGTSNVFAVKEAVRQLKEAGYKQLEYQNDWGLNFGGKYYMVHHDTSLFAFTIGNEFGYRDSYRIGAAHTDFPCLRIKPNPDIKSGNYHQVNIEVYGGAILNSWLDKPLSISGRVGIKSEDVFHPKMKYIFMDRPIMLIPNLAIHMNKQVNKGMELNKQKDMLPIIGMGRGESNAFMEFLSKELYLNSDEILDYELWVYCMQPPIQVGIQNDFLLSPRLDNLTSVQALLTALINSDRSNGVNLIALFDHEEIGSKTKQGADSMILLNILEKISYCFGRTNQQVKETMYQSMMISVDVAHGAHPNYMDKMDPTNKPELNKGFCIKEAGSQSYATDCEMVSVVEQICQKENIPYQKFVNRSDSTGGSTIGSIASSVIPVRTVDIGVPILAMHSSVETMGVKDQKSLTDFLKCYFNT